MFDGYKIIDYLGVESGVTIMGSGVILDWSEEILKDFK